MSSSGVRHSVVARARVVVSCLKSGLTPTAYAARHDVGMSERTFCRWTAFVRECAALFVSSASAAAPLRSVVARHAHARRARTHTHARRSGTAIDSPAFTRELVAAWLAAHDANAREAKVATRQVLKRDTGAGLFALTHYAANPTLTAAQLREAVLARHAEFGLREGDFTTSGLTQFMEKHSSAWRQTARSRSQSQPRSAIHSPRVRKFVLATHRRTPSLTRKQLHAAALKRFKLTRAHVSFSSFVQTMRKWLAEQQPSSSEASSGGSSS
jgi:hypothetical protein